MKIIDLSLSLHEGMMTFPTHWHPVVEISILGRHGIEGRETRKLVLGTHTGTHTDAPLHFIPKGKSIDEVPLDVLVGEATVVNFAPAKPNQEIGIPALKQALEHAHAPEQNQGTVSSNPFDPAYRLVRLLRPDAVLQQLSLLLTGRRALAGGWRLPADRHGHSFSR